ncbi:MAG TPA: hypothetical protein VMW42_12945 [Desulfatiglandales bacterium]|nr:hypothetical protein [Desulfatiglandales bacterium]
MYKIDFEELRTGYNRIYGTDYLTVKSLLFGLYNKDPNVKKIARILGISHTTVRAEMVRQGIGLLPQFNRGDSKGLRDIKALGKKKDLSAMECEEIASILGYSPQYVGSLLSKNKITYMRRKYSKRRGK